MRVFACPLRVGAGVKGKIAAAMSYGVPVVTTSIGAEGMELQQGLHALLANEPAVSMMQSAIYDIRVNGCA